ncbi:Clp protease ClpP [Mycolicibacterium sp. 3033]|nr:Clp protease ClpP [Mycolicibacterium aurantiacum]
MAELRIYDSIGYGGVTAAAVADQLDEMAGATRLDVRINSPGGSVFDGIAIHNAIARHPARTTIYIDALAGSAASFVAMAGDEIVINRYAKMMIHDASGITIGNAADMGAAMRTLDMLSQTIAEVYADRAGKTAEHWRRTMLAETWYSAEDAVAAGLADRVELDGRKASGPSATASRSSSLDLVVAVAGARRRRTHRILTQQKG